MFYIFDPKTFDNFCSTGGNMKSINFWKTEIKQLSLTERMFFKDVIKTLLNWETLRKEYKELDLIRRILESEAQINTFQNKKSDINIKKWWEDKSTPV